MKTIAEIAECRLKTPNEIAGAISEIQYLECFKILPKYAPVINSILVAATMAGHENALDKVIAFTTEFVKSKKK